LILHMLLMNLKELRKVNKPQKKYYVVNLQTNKIETIRTDKKVAQQDVQLLWDVCYKPCKIESGA
jgi:hypothetical protein